MRLYVLAVILALTINFLTARYFHPEIDAAVARGLMSGVCGGQIAWWITTFAEIKRLAR